MKLARNLLILALLAAALAFLPAGGNVFDAFMVLLSLVFLSAITWTVAQFVSRNELTFGVLNDGQRLLLYGAAAVVVLLIAGSETFFNSGPGTVAWIALLVGSIFVAWRVWSDANSY
jgi:hypothetical protein